MKDEQALSLGNEQVLSSGNKKLYRSRKDRMIFGVIGGLGEYFEIDSNLLRLVWILIVVFTGFIPGILAYIIAAIIIPEEPK